jgi:hypothetical protein
MEPPVIPDGDIIASVRARLGASATDVRVLKRTHLHPTAGLTGSYFERVRLGINGRNVPAILKYGTMPVGPPTREALFFARLRDGVPIDAPACFATGPLDDGRDSWVLMERLPRGKRLVDWTLEDTKDAVRALARLHAAYLDSAPAELPRPLTADLDRSLSFVPPGVVGLRAVYEEFPHLPRVASDRALALLMELCAAPDVLRSPLCRSPETLLHGDYHRGNLLRVHNRRLVAFDWQFVCAGPPVYDLAVFWSYLGAVNKPGFFRFFDRADVEERSLGWDETCAIYANELRALRPDAPTDAIFAAADAAFAWEIVRQVTYMAAGLTESFGPFLRFIYRDHRTIGGWFARWIGIDAGWRLYRQVFSEFEERAERLLRLA